MHAAAAHEAALKPAAPVHYDPFNPPPWPVAYPLRASDIKLDPTDPSLWKRVASAYGQTEANAIRKLLDDAIAKMSDHFDRYNVELSFIAGINCAGSISRISGKGVRQ